MKKVIAAVLAGLSFSVIPVADAAPVNLTGDISLKYERDTAEGSEKTSGTMYNLKLNAEKELGAGWSVYARIAAQYATEPSLGDYNQDAYRSDKKSVVALDQFGVSYKTEKLVYKLGRQDAAVGTTALLYSRPDSNVGKRNFVDGLSATGTIGVVELSALMAKEDNTGSQDNKIYAIRTGYNLTDRLNWGLTLGRYQDSANDSTNHWAVDGTYKVGKSGFTAEYTQSSSSNENKAYAAIWNYGFDNKTAVQITGFKVETNGDMGKQSDFDNDNRGFYYGVTHKLNDTESLEVVYKDQKTISGGQKNTKLEATFSHAF